MLVGDISLRQTGCGSGGGTPYYKRHNYVLIFLSLIFPIIVIIICYYLLNIWSRQQLYEIRTIIVVVRHLGSRSVYRKSSRTSWSNKVVFDLFPRTCIMYHEDGSFTGCFIDSETRRVRNCIFEAAPPRPILEFYTRLVALIKYDLLPSRHTHTYIYI